jgi:uncharacterized DUF497 family protein
MSIVSGFDWDDGNWPKCGKHGVTREEIESLFESRPWIFPDEKHSEREQRFLAIGVCHSGRHLFVAFTLRERDGKKFIRPISARYMHRKEVKHYEKWRQERPQAHPETDDG